VAVRRLLGDPLDEPGKAPSADGGSAAADRHR